MPETVRYRWLTFMYGANVAISGPIGAFALLAPTTFRGITSLPAQDPIHFGIASGAVPLAFGLAGLWGLRAPVRAAPVLLLQLCYKLLFLGGVALPLALSSSYPQHALPLIVIFLFFVVGNAIALPFSHLFGESSSSQPSS